MNDLSLIKSLVDLGCTVVICGFLLMIFYRLSVKFGTAFIESQQKMAEAMAGVNMAIQTYIQKDNTEHREILLAVQVVGEHLKWLREDVAAAAKAGTTAAEAGAAAAKAAASSADARDKRDAERA